MDPTMKQISIKSGFQSGLYIAGAQTDRWVPASAAMSEGSTEQED